MKTSSALSVVGLLVLGLLILSSIGAIQVSHAVTTTLAVSLDSAGFSDTSVHATASPPSGSGSVVLTGNPGDITSINVIITASGGVTFGSFDISDVNLIACSGGGGGPVINSLPVAPTSTSIDVSITCQIAGTTLAPTSSLVVFLFSWTSTSAGGSVSISDGSIAVTSSTQPVLSTTGATVVPNTSSSVPEFPVSALSSLLLIALLLPALLLMGRKFRAVRSPIV